MKISPKKPKVPSFLPQLQPPKVAFYDNIASVSALSFTDQDADAEEIGGVVGVVGVRKKRAC